MIDSKEQEFRSEVERIESNSHKFLTYFGIFWGAILIFIVQNYAENSIASTLGSYAAKFFSNPFGDVNIMGFTLIFLGIIYILLSLVFFCMNAVTTSPYQIPVNKRDKYVAERKDILVRGVQMGLIGTVLLFVLFIFSLMLASPDKAASVEKLGTVFFWTLFAMLFFVDPIYVFAQRGANSLLSWLNLAASFFIGIIFILSKVSVKLPLWLVFIFLIVFVVYFIVRFIFTLWKQPLLISKAITAFTPDIPMLKL